jgi:hypothetical protein
VPHLSLLFVLLSASAPLVTIPEGLRFGSSPSNLDLPAHVLPAGRGQMKGIVALTVASSVLASGYAWSEYESP